MDIDVEEYGERAICEHCVGDNYLAKQIELNGEVETCFYCEEDERRTWLLSEVADAVEAAFQQHFRRTPDQPDGLQSMMLADKEGTYEWDRDGEQTVYAIMNALNSSEEIASDLQQYLEKKHEDWDAAVCGQECEFASEAYYEEIMPSDGAWHEEWQRFERNLKRETRFFSGAAQEYLKSIFGGVDTMKTAKGRPVVIEAGPEQEILGFYRGRVFYSDDKLEVAMKRPDLELGPPPSELAPAGRMNAHGVSVFYGADSVLGAIAEVRPPVASRVLIGRFDLLRKVRLLDFQALRSVTESGSIFDPYFADRLSRQRFLRSLKYKISRPVMPTDEAFDYLATQAVVDFLANGLETELDGVLFPSAQTGDKSVNVVMFHRASRVQEIVLPDGSEIDATTYMHTNEGAEPWFTVTENTPREKMTKSAEWDKAMLTKLPSYFAENRFDADERADTLTVNLDCLEVHIVSEIGYKTDDHKVLRHRRNKPDYDQF
ncbi:MULTISPECIES: RES family NAD+ phosphorylase [Roseibium]|uniref:RES family NAD+ phosphorylase n=1 Tax=Roseibium TaxID=150830 RepID=UPI0032662B08